MIDTILLAILIALFLFLCLGCVFICVMMYATLVELHRSKIRKLPDLQELIIPKTEVPEVIK